MVGVTPVNYPRRDEHASKFISSGLHSRSPSWKLTTAAKQVDMVWGGGSSPTRLHTFTGCVALLAPSRGQFSPTQPQGQRLRPFCILPKGRAI